MRSIARAGAILLLLGAATARAAPPAADDLHIERPASAADSNTQINRKVTDPVSTTWSLKIINEVTLREVGSGGEHAKYELRFQPTMPLLLTGSVKLITRPEFTLIDDTPYSGSQGTARTTGVGDTILDMVLSPELGPWLLGLGPTFVFPTANLDQTGQGKWQMGPAGVVGYRTKTWLATAIAQQWWSFAGAPSRAAVSELHFQYIASYFFGDGWSVGTSPTIKVDWRAPAGDQLTFPVGPTAGKVLKLGGSVPIKLEMDAVYMAVRPDHDGERCAFELKIIPVVPAPLQRPLYDPSFASPGAGGTPAAP